MEGKKWFAYGTRHTLAVTHPVTNRARRCLTSVIGRELLVSTCYGRRHKLEFRSRHMLNFRVFTDFATFLIESNFISRNCLVTSQGTVAER